MTQWQTTTDYRLLAMFVLQISAIAPAALAAYGISWMCRFNFPVVNIVNLPAFFTVLAPIGVSSGLWTTSVGIAKNAHWTFIFGCVLTTTSLVVLLYLLINRHFYWLRVMPV